MNVLRVGEDDDSATAVCKTSLFVKPTEAPGLWPIIDIGGPMSTKDRQLAYVRACKQVYEALPEGEQRAILAAFRPKLGIPALVDPEATAPRIHGARAGDAEAFRQQREVAAAARPSLAERWADEWAPKGAAADGPRPVQPEVVSGAEGVADAVWRGKVAIFDATKLLPHELFNITFTDIARMHGEEAKNVTLFRQLSYASFGTGRETLESYASMEEAMRSAGKLYFNDIVPTPRDPSWRPPPPSASSPWWLRGLHAAIHKALGVTQDSEITIQRWAHHVRRELTMMTVNTRRLPKLPVDMEKALGNPPWLERAQPILWTGAVGSWWHNDEPDNLLMSLHGEMDVAVFDPADTDAISGARGSVHSDIPFDLSAFQPDSVDEAWLKNNLWIKKFPYVRVRLKPGMGIVVPSRAYHAVWVEGADRLLLNCFMTPRYKAMESSPATSSSFFGRGRQPDLYMAMFHLKMSSIARAWETDRAGGWFEMAKLESL